MVDALRQRPEIEWRRERAIRLLRERGRVVGVLTRRRDGSAVAHLAAAVVLATGGLGGLFSHTTNPRGSMGDGLAMALEAGALAVDLEFVQFHPTALAVGEDPMPLVTEALRGAGAMLVDGEGRRFMPPLHREAELAPRDVVARAVWRRQREGQESYLDAGSVQGDLRARFPTVWKSCREYGIEMGRDLIPIAAAAHYHMGGVLVDSWGRSSLPGLWAVGEVSSTGLHGANRLASNSLLEALVFGHRVARDLAAIPGWRGPVRLPEALASAPASAAGDESFSSPLLERLRHMMWQGVGVERSAAGLDRALAEIRSQVAKVDGDAAPAHPLLVAEAMVRAARERLESRGAHQRSDYPAAEESWRQRIALRRVPGESGETAWTLNRMPLEAFEAETSVEVTQ
jgi:L-aspartate oxidase